MFGILRFVPVSGGKIVEHLVSQRLTYVGRDKDCSIRLEDHSVDGKQFVISCSDQVKIQNLSRKLPTLVNQKSIGLRENQELKDKDTISFGNRQFVWIMSSSSGRRDPPKHDCLNRKRASEPVRKVAVVTPNRRDVHLEEDGAAMPPDAKRRRTMDPSAATPDTCFSRRVRYDRKLRQNVNTPNRGKYSVGRTPTSLSNNSTKKKSISFARPLESPQMNYAFNKSITPGRFYRRNDGPFEFRGFNNILEEPISPGLLSGCDSFLSMDNSQMTRRSSARVSTPYPNRTMRGSSQLNKTQSPGPSGMYFPSIQEEVTQNNQHGATPSSYFSSTSGSPRIMRAESPTIVPGGSGSTFQGRRSLVQSSRSSSYGTPQEQSLQSQNDSLFVNASSTSQMRLQDFEGSSMNQSRYWSAEGISSPRSNSFAKTPPFMRTPRRSRGATESPGSAAFSPNPSEANTSGYVLLSPRGKGIIDRAFNRNDMSLQQLSPQRLPLQRPLNFTPRTPDNRRHGEPAQSLSFQVLTKSLRKKLNRTPLSDNSYNPMGTPRSGKRGKKPKNLEDFVEIPTTPERALNGTPRSTDSKRAARSDLGYPDLFRVSSSTAPSPSKPVGASKRKSSVRSNHDNPSKNTPPARTPSRLSGKSSDLQLQTTPDVGLNSEPQKSIRPSISARKSVTDESVSPQSATPRVSRSSKHSLKISPRPSSAPVVLRVSRTSANVESTASPVGTSDRRSSIKGDIHGTPQPTLRRGSLCATPRQSSKSHSPRLSQKSSDLRRSIPLTPAEVPYSEPKRSNKRTPNSDSRNKRVSVKNELRDSPSLKATPRQSRLSKRPVSPTARQSSEPNLSRSSQKSGSLRKSALQLTPIGAPKNEKKLSLASSSDVIPLPPKRSKTFTFGSPTRAEKQESSEKSPLSNGSASARSDLFSNHVTPPSECAEVILRSSRKLSTKKKDSPSTPLSASKVVSALQKRALSKSLSADILVNTSPKSSARNSLPVTLARSRRKSETSPVEGEAQTERSGLQSSSKSQVQAKVKSPIPNRRSSASLVGRSSGTPTVIFSRRSGIQKTPDRKISPLKSPVEKPEDRRSVNRRSRASLGSRSSGRSGTRSTLSLPSGIRKTTVGKRSSLASETREHSGKAGRRSRASLVGDAAEWLHLSATPGSPKTNSSSVIPVINVIPATPTPTKSADVTPALEGPVLERRSSRRSGTSNVLAVHHGIRKTSIGKRSSNKSETPQSTEVGPKSPKRAGASIKSSRSSQRSSNGERATVPPLRTSTSSSKSEDPVTPPRSVEPEIVMRSSKKATPRLQDGSGVPSTPTSAIRRMNTRSGKKAFVSTSFQKLILSSPRKDSVVKKLSLDPKKPDKKKLAALIACHKKKPPTKEKRPSLSSSDTSPDKSDLENLTPLKDLDAQPEERSPEDALLNALDLSRTSAIVAQPKRPSRRLRSSTNRRISAPFPAYPISSKSTSPASPPKSSKEVLFKTPLVEYEGSHRRAEISPSGRLKGILMTSPTIASEEPMSRVFTTSPVVDFTDASGRKKIFRASPNSKSKAGGIRELVPEEASDLNIWTLFESSTSSSGSSGRKRKGSEPTDITPPKKTNTPGNLGSASPLQSTRRKRAAAGGTAVSTSKRSRNVAGGSVKKAVVKSSHRASKAKLTSPKFSTGRESLNSSSRKAASPKVSPKQLRKAGAKAKTPSKAKASKTLTIRSKAGRVESRKLTPRKSPAKPGRAAAKPSKNSSPKRLSRAGKAGTTVQLSKTPSSKAKPKKAVLPSKAKSPLKAGLSKVKKSSSPVKSPLKTRRGAGAAKSPKRVAPAKIPAKSAKKLAPAKSPAKSPKKVASAKSQSKSSKASKKSNPAASPAKTRQRGGVKPVNKGAKVQAPVVGRKAAPPIPVKSPLKTRRVAAVKSPKKTLQKAQPKAGKAVKPAKSPLKASPSKRKVAQKAPPKTGKPAKSSPKAKSPKATTSKAKPKKVSPPKNVSPKKTRGMAANLKTEAPKPAQLAKPKAPQGAKPRLSVPPKPLKGKAIGANKSSKSQKIGSSPVKSPKLTRSRRVVAASKARK